MTQGVAKAAGNLSRARALSLAVLAALCCVLAVASSAASAATLEVPSEFDTVQAAVDAADQGDTIEVRARKASYLEQVLVETPGITIAGVGGRPVIDGFDPSSVTTLEVVADDVEVRNLQIRNEDGYSCIGDGCAVRNVTFAGYFNTDCIEIDGDDAVVAKTRMTACGNQGIDIDGSDARVLGNQADGIDADCIFVDGESPTIKGNTSLRCEDDQGIEVNNGDGAVVTDNVVRRTDSGGIFVDGDGVRIEGNETRLMDSTCFELNGDDGVVRDNVVVDCEGGIDAFGDGWTIRGNRVADGMDRSCVDVEGDGGVVTRNRIDDCYRGIQVLGEGYVTRNQISDVHTDDGIRVSCFDDPDPPDPTSCDEIRVASNEVIATGDDDSGISVFVEDGSGSAAIVDNKVSDAFDDGIEAQFDNGLIEGNKVTRSGAEEEEGIDVIGFGNVIRGNVSTKNGGDGILVSASDDGGGSVIKNNVVRSNNQNGIRTEGDGDIVEGNLARANNGDGIEIDGTAVDVIGNVASGNRIDCATDGSVVVNEDNDCADGSDFLITSSGLPF